MIIVILVISFCVMTLVACKLWHSKSAYTKDKVAGDIEYEDIEVVPVTRRTNDDAITNSAALKQGPVYAEIGDGINLEPNEAYNLEIGITEHQHAHQVQIKKGKKFNY